MIYHPQTRRPMWVIKLMEQKTEHGTKYCSVLDLAQSLHEFCTGSCDALRDKDAQKINRALKWILSHWMKPQTVEWAEYDFAVRHLLECAIREYEARS